VFEQFPIDEKRHAHSKAYLFYERAVDITHVQKQFYSFI